MEESRSGAAEREEAPQVIAETPPTASERAVAFIEVLICSDYPTQIAIAATLGAIGLHPQGANGLSLGYVAALSLADAVFLTCLILYILRVRGESAADLFFGGRSIRAEALAGVPLLFVAFAIAVAVLLTVRVLAPWLRTVPHNPLQDLVQTPGDAGLFAIVLIVAGGLREEIQRAFLLRRFERWLGGPRVGLVATSVIFGAGHYVQGADAAVATAALGAFWGFVYLKRRSIAAPVVSHSGFNLVQVLQYFAVPR